MCSRIEFHRAVQRHRALQPMADNSRSSGRLQTVPIPMGRDTGRTAVPKFDRAKHAPYSESSERHQLFHRSVTV